MTIVESLFLPDGNCYKDCMFINIPYLGYSYLEPLFRFKYVIVVEISCENVLVNSVLHIKEMYVDAIKE